MTTQWKRLDEPAPPRIDPYLDWATSRDPEQFGSFLERRAIPLLFELNIPAADFAVGRLGGGRNLPDDRTRWLAVPDFYAHPSAGLEATTFCTGLVSENFFTELKRNDALRDAIKRFQYGLPVEPSSPAGMLRATDQPHRAFHRRAQHGKGGGVPAGEPVIGVIDDALAVAHQRFCRSDGSTRVEHLWDQYGTSTVLGLPYGQEHPGTTITSAIQASRWGGLVDAEEVYRALGMEDYSVTEHKALGRRGAHGTHVMDIACGLDPAGVSAGKFPIIGVQLPGRTVRDTSGGYLYPQVYDALRYILHRADQIAGPVPVVVNLSYGTIAGPHDGSSPLEAAVDELIRLRKTNLPDAPLEVVLPSGNNHLYRCHAQAALPHGQRQSLDWRILPDGRTPSFLEIWLPKPDAYGARQVKVTVTTPTGDASPPIREGDSFEWRPHAAVLCKVIYTKLPASGDRPLIQITVDATATLDPNREIAPSGIWHITIENTGPDAAIEAWIQRNDTPYGWPILGRQSRFEDANYVRFEPSGRDREQDDLASYVKRADTINGIATGDRPIVIAGCRYNDLASAKYSAAGPVAIGSPRVGRDPNAMAVSDISVACHGVLAAGTRSGSVFALDGTSVAAPQLTRWIWQQMHGKAASDSAAVEYLAQTEETGHKGLVGSPFKPRPPHNRGGAGRIDDVPLRPPPNKIRWSR